MNGDAEESLRLRLGALRVDPPSNGFDERLRARLELESQQPARHAEVIRPARFRIRGGRVGLLAVAALCFAGAAAAVVGTGQRLALWSPAPAPAAAPVLEQPQPLTAQSPKRSPKPRTELPIPAHAEPPASEPPVSILELQPAAPNPVAVPSRIPRLATSFARPENTVQLRSVEVPRETGPGEPQNARSEQPTRVQIPRLEARLDTPEINRAGDTTLSQRDERNQHRPGTERGALPRQAELARQKVEHRLEERFERRGGPARAQPRAAERPSPSVERRGNSGAGRARGGRPD